MQLASVRRKGLWIVACSCLSLPAAGILLAATAASTATSTVSAGLNHADIRWLRRVV